MPGQKTVLIIEDEEDIREALKLILGFEGYAVRTAANGREGRARLDELGGNCVVLLDLMMPVMNGWEFLDDLRHQPPRLFPHIVVVTAYAEKAATLGVAAVERKPVDMDHLLQRIHTAFQAGPVP